MKNGEKIRICSEAIYLASIIILALAVSMLTAADFGLSMVVAPAYILSCKTGFLTFGQCEYILQSLLFILFCILMKKVRPVYFGAYITCIIYGAVLDLWRTVIPAFRTGAEPLPTEVRIVFFVIGMLLTSFSVSLSFKTYIYPQINDFFVNAVSGKFELNLAHFKFAFDLCCLALSFAMTLLMFKKIVGIGVGTLIMALLNGFLIGKFGELYDKYFESVPIFKKFAAYFEI